MILLTGAAGKTGQSIIEALSKRKETVRALVHRRDQVSAIQSLGVNDVLVGDLCDKLCMDQAVQGVRAVYHLAPNISPDEELIGATIIEAARSANVEHFIFHSVLHPQIESMPHHFQKLRVEEKLFESCLSFTILQPTVYMQNILAGWNQIVQNGKYRVPYSLDTRVSLVDLKDVAEAAAIILTEPGHEGASIELVGTPALCQMEIAEIIQEQLGQPVVAEVVPLEEWERNARASGLGEYQVLTLIKMFSYYERYGFIGNSNQLSYLLHRQPASLAEFVGRTLHEREYANRDN